MEFLHLPFDIAADHSLRQFYMLCRYNNRKGKREADKKPDWWKQKKGPPPSPTEILAYRIARAEWDRKHNRLGFNPLTIEDYRKGRHKRKG